MQAGLGEAERHLVLVVDDDRAVGKLIRHNLGSKSIYVVDAASGLDCIKILRKTKVDLIILDIKLPDFNGWGILSLLRLTEPLRHIPVIIVSVEPPDAALIERLQPDAYIQKPFDIRDLLLRVKELIGSKSAGQYLVNKVK